MGTSTQQQHLLIVGAGSVGKRHLENFARLGCVVSAADPRPDRLDEAAARGVLQHRFADWRDALERRTEFSGVVICSPPKFHVEQSIAALTAGLPVFLEKPVSPDAESSARLMAVVQRTGVPLLLGYTYRWWPALQELRRRVAAGAVGAVRHVRCVMSAHLADWHPWERYQDFFMASAELGGGALLDESHFLDLMVWFFGVPARVFARVERLSSLAIDTDDTVDAWMEYPDNLRITLHLDLLGRPHEKCITVTGDNGTLHWSFDPNRLRYSGTMEPQWDDQLFTHERNVMFVEAAKEFLAVVEHGKAPSCTMADGHAVMRIIEAMRCSSAAGRIVAMEAAC